MKNRCRGTYSSFLIGPDNERWDAAMPVQQSSPAAFMAFASKGDYLAGMGHRTAALEDSRLLPLEESGLVSSPPPPQAQQAAGGDQECQ
jgi:hypothetical protein